MRAPVGWLREYAALPEELSARDLAEALISAGLEVETVDAAGADISGPLVVGKVLEFVEEPQKNGKTIRWCQVDVGEESPRGIVCGARNFAVGDLVVVSLPGSVLPGGFAIAARKTYGHVSDGMICSVSELGIGEDHSGILILDPVDDDGNAVRPGDAAAPVLHLREDVLDIAVTPDMGYCLSIRGLAREAAQALGVAFTDPIGRAVPTESTDGFSVRVEDSAACPVFAALSVDGVDPSRPSPRWLARRVQLAGMRPISLAVDITNYVMLETGQPLHAYDAERLADGIVVRSARAGEQLITLDDATRTLDPTDLVITDSSGPIGLAGVMGGASTELSPSTTKVVIEAAHFDPLRIARTSRRHKLSSEASRRFERGVDPAATYAAAHRVADLLVRLGGGTLSERETVVGEVPAQPQQQIDTDLPQRILGGPVPAERVVEVLTASGVQVVRDGNRLTLTPPTWRPDLRDPYDYVEEVGCKVGLDVMETVVPQAPVGRGLTASQKARRAINRALTSAGFVEVLTFPFAASGELDQMGIAAEDPRRALVRLANPLSEMQPFLRTTLLPGLFSAANRNTSRSNDDLALFEAGSVFRASAGGAAPTPPVTRRPNDAELEAFAHALPAQPRHLAAVISGDWLPAGWIGQAQRASWRHAAAFVETAATALGVSVAKEATHQAPWHPGRCAAYSVGDRLIGYAGELHPTVCQAFGLPARTCAAEIDLDALIEAAPGVGSVTRLSPFPVAKEDVALVVDESVTCAAVEAALREGAGELLESIRLFDVYTGEQIAEGKKSLAYALRLRSATKTLTDAEAAQARDAAVAAAGKATGAVMRS